MLSLDDRLSAAILSASGITDSQRVAMIRVALNGHAPPLPLHEKSPSATRGVARRRGTIGPRPHRYPPKTKLHAEWRRRREEAGMLQADFARELGITPSIIRALEGGFRDRTSGPDPERHAEAECAYTRWLDAKTAPTR